MKDWRGILVRERMGIIFEMGRIGEEFCVREGLGRNSRQGRIGEEFWALRDRGGNLG